MNQKTILLAAAAFLSPVALAMGGAKPGCELQPRQKSLADIVKKHVPRGSNGRASAASILRTDPEGNVVEIGYEKNSSSFQAVASTQKIVTAWVTTKYVRDLSKLVRFNENDLFHDNQGARAIRRQSGNLIRVGEQVAVSEYLYTLLNQSSNGAAQALSRAPTSTTSGFVQLMNAEAELMLGEGHASYFQNPSGLTDDSPAFRFAGNNRQQGSNAREMAALAGKIMSNTNFRERLHESGVSSVLQGTLYKLGSTRAAGHTLVAHFAHPKQGCSGQGIAMAFFGEATGSQFARFEKAFQKIYETVSR